MQTKQLKDLENLQEAWRQAYTSGALRLLSTYMQEHETAWDMEISMAAAIRDLKEE